jgi:uncharacterized protein YjbI with pentapeptide repeats
MPDVGWPPIGHEYKLCPQINNFYTNESWVKIGSDDVASDSVGADDVGADAVGADTVWAHAVGTDVVGTNAVGTDVTGTDAVGADAVGADAVGADSFGTDIVGSKSALVTEFSSDVFFFFDKKEARLCCPVGATRLVGIDCFWSIKSW